MMLPVALPSATCAFAGSAAIRVRDSSSAAMPPPTLLAGLRVFPAPSEATALHRRQRTPHLRRRTTSTRTVRCPAPRCVREDIVVADGPLSAAELRFGSIEESDVPACVALLLECFYKDTLTLAAEEFSQEEMKLLRPALTGVNDFLAGLNRASLLFDLRRRMGSRFVRGDLQRKPHEPVMLALQNRTDGRMLGVVEVSDEPMDGKLPGDLRLPSIFGKPSPRTAYIANLAVAKSCRQQGIGTALLRAAESLAAEWGFQTVCLHASRSKENLMTFYASQQYKPLAHLDQPEWVDTFYGREPLRFFQRNIVAGS